MINVLGRLEKLFNEAKLMIDVVKYRSLYEQLVKTLPKEKSQALTKKLELFVNNLALKDEPEYSDTYSEISKDFKAIFEEYLNEDGKIKEVFKKPEKDLLDKQD
jgi:hypothetical protein